MTVRATNSEASRANVTVSAKGRKNWLTMPPTKPSGRNTATVVSVLLVMAPATSRVPVRTASPIGSPRPRCRKMFSRTTMASSTTRPTATARAPRVMMLMVRPARPMMVRAVRIDSGMLTAATSVERRLSRNRKMVRTANRAPSRPSRTRPSRDSLMKFAVSEMVSMAMASGCWR